jgi:hypothetical protein
MAEGGQTRFLYARDSSLVEMTGGSVRNAGGARDSSTFTITGGTTGHPLEPSLLFSTGSATVIKSGGIHHGSLYASGSSHFIFDGGTAVGENIDVLVRGESLFELTGGGFDDIAGTGRGIARDSSTVIQTWSGPTYWYLHDTSTATITTGGSIFNAKDASTINLSHPEGARLERFSVGGSATGTLAGRGEVWQVPVYGELLVEGSVMQEFHVGGSGYAKIRGLLPRLYQYFSSGSGGTIEIPGTDFHLNGVPVPYGDISTHDEGTLTGTLVTGDALTVVVSRRPHNTGVNGSIVLVPSSRVIYVSKV